MESVVIERAVPTNKSLYNSVKSRIKKKYKVWPSAYASAALVKAYKAAGGGYRNESLVIENPEYVLDGYTIGCDDKITELHFVLKEAGQTLLGEAEYRGRKVSLGKPFRTPSGPKKFSVYVKNEKGNIVKVNFGDPNMEIKRDDPNRRKNFRARHRCENPGPKTKARYWACRTWEAGKSVTDITKGK